MIKAHSSVDRQLSLCGLGRRDIFHLLPVVARRDLINELELNVAKHASAASVLIQKFESLQIRVAVADFLRSKEDLGWVGGWRNWFSARLSGRS